MSKHTPTTEAPARRFTTRFAPSPTGLLHLGHAYSALLAAAAARASGGRFLLRIEDIDGTRCRPEYEQALLEDLRWLGLAWEEPVLRQSDERATYASALDRLRTAGLLYRCFLTRREISSQIQDAEGQEAAFTGSPLSAPEERARLEAGAPFAWRLSLARVREHLGPAFEGLTFREENPAGGQARETPVRPEEVGDIVLARKDVGVAYHLAAVVDDARQEITHVIRGEDLRAAAPAHRILQAALGLPAPVYRHHPLIRDAAGHKLAKRAASPSLRAFRAEGLNREALLARLPPGLA